MSKILSIYLSHESQQKLNELLEINCSKNPSELFSQLIDIAYSNGKDIDNILNKLDDNTTGGDDFETIKNQLIKFATNLKPKQIKEPINKNAKIHNSIAKFFDVFRKASQNDSLENIQYLTAGEIKTRCELDCNVSELMIELDIELLRMKNEIGKDKCYAVVSKDIEMPKDLLS